MISSVNKEAAFKLNENEKKKINKVHKVAFYRSKTRNCIKEKKTRLKISTVSLNFLCCSGNRFSGRSTAILKDDWKNDKSIEPSAPPAYFLKKFLVAHILIFFFFFRLLPFIRGRHSGFFFKHPHRRFGSVLRRMPFLTQTY